MLDGIGQKVCGKGILITSWPPQVSVFKWQDRHWHQVFLVTVQPTQWLQLSEGYCTWKVQFSKNLLKTTGMSFLRQWKRNLSQSKTGHSNSQCFSKVFLSSFGTLCRVFNLENWIHIYVYFCQPSCFPGKKKEITNNCFWDISKNWGGENKSNLQNLWSAWG